MVMSRHQNVEQISTLLITNKSFENVEKLVYLGMRLTNQNYIHETVSRLNSLNPWYH